MKTVTICGSMRFEKEMQSIAFFLETKHDMSVLQCSYNVDNVVFQSFFEHDKPSCFVLICGAE